MGSMMSPILSIGLVLAFVLLLEGPGFVSAQGPAICEDGGSGTFFPAIGSEHEWPTGVQVRCSRCR